MESFFSRYRNEWVLVGILFVQLIALATQVRVPVAQAKGASTEMLAPPAQPGGGTRLIRVWAAGAVSPFQRLAVNSSRGIRNLWADYIDLRGVRKENEALKREVTELRFAKDRVEQDAEQGRRLQALLDFKQQYINKTVAAQVIGTSGTELSRVIYIDRGTRDGIQPGMAVITPDGVVGKISRADRTLSQVLLINDPQSGAGVLLERLHINGILKGGAGHLPEMQNVMADEKLQVGDRVVTTGGDRVFPRGLPVGTVESFSPDRDRDPFLNIKVKPAVELGKLEEVLVVTELLESAASPATTGTPVRASDVLAERLPSVKKKTEEQTKAEEKSAASAQTHTESVPSGVDTTPAESKPPTAPPSKPTTGPSEIKPVVPNTKPEEARPSNPPQDQRP